MKSLGFLHASRHDQISRLIKFICQLDVLEELNFLGCGKLTNNLPNGSIWNLGKFVEVGFVTMSTK
jgi:hypothetical protein